MRISGDKTLGTKELLKIEQVVLPWCFSSSYRFLQMLPNGPSDNMTNVFYLQFDFLPFSPKKNIENMAYCIVFDNFGSFGLLND